MHSMIHTFRFQEVSSIFHPACLGVFATRYTKYCISFLPLIYPILYTQPPSHTPTCRQLNSAVMVTPPWTGIKLVPFLTKICCAYSTGSIALYSRRNFGIFNFFIVCSSVKAWRCTLYTSYTIIETLTGSSCSSTENSTEMMLHLWLRWHSVVGYIDIRNLKVE